MAGPFDPSHHTGPHEQTDEATLDSTDGGQADGAAIAHSEAQPDADPAEPGTWFEQARRLAADGQADAAREACRRALELWPDIMPLYALLSELGLSDLGLSELGLSDPGLPAGAPPDAAAVGAQGQTERLALARRMLLAATPDDPVLANRIAQDLCTEGRFAEALPYLRISAPRLGHADFALWNYTSSLAVTGSYHELLSIEPMLTEFARGSAGPFTPFAHLAAAKLALQGDREAVCRALALRRGTADWLDTASLAQRLQQAISDHVPFSVITLSEGDARLFVYGSLKYHLQLSEAELSAVVNSVWTESFGGTIEAHGALAAGRLARFLHAGIDTADVTGIPEAAHLANAREHSGFLVELLDGVLSRPSPLCAGLDVMSALHDSMPFFRPLLAELPFLGLVGCYPDLADALARFCQIRETATYPVPAALNRHDIHQSLRGHDHFPDRFEHIMGELTVPYPGAVFLVAAGPLGPAYCGRIKQLGGIAIDVDPVITRWMQR